MGFKHLLIAWYQRVCKKVLKKGCFVWSISQTQNVILQTETSIPQTRTIILQNSRFIFEGKVIIPKYKLNNEESAKDPAFYFLKKTVFIENKNETIWVVIW